MTSIENLIAAAGTNVSIGSLILDKHDNFTKINAHRHFGSNNKIISAEQNEAVRRKVYETFASAVGNRKGAEAFLKAVAEQLGLYENDVVIKPLARREVRQMICNLNAFIGKKCSFDSHLKNIINHPDRFGDLGLRTLLESFDKDAERFTPEEKEARRLCCAIIRNKLGKKNLSLRRFDSVPLSSMKDIAIAALRGGIDSEKKLNEWIADRAGKPLLNDRDTIGIVSAFEKLQAEDRAKVSLPQDWKGEKKPKSSRDLLRATFTALFPIFGSHSERPAEVAPASSIRELIADIISESDTIAVDRMKGDLGERLSFTLRKHLDALVSMLRHPDDSVKSLPKEYQPVVKELCDRLLARSEVTDLLKNTNDSAVKVGLNMALKLPSSLKALAEVEEEIDKKVNEFCAKEQKDLVDCFEQLLTPKDDVSKSPLDQPDDKRTGDIRHKGDGYVSFEQMFKKVFGEKVDAPTDHKLVMLAGKDILARMTGGGALDKTRGYGKFILESLNRYFKDLGIEDKRRMLSAGIRYSKDNATQEDVLCAMLKGAGPIMQKMLQGLASMDVDPKLKEILKDMKGNLAPIPRDIVEANLHAIIANSNKGNKDNKIVSIKVISSMGAASVGEAFKCEIKLKGKKPEDPPVTKEVIIKMLRPDVEKTIQREKEVFINAAKKVKGMSKTFEGQLKSIYEELDLRVEARNIIKGSVYNTGVSDIRSCRLLDEIVPPTRTVLVEELAPGMTVDKYFGKVDSTIKESTAKFFDEKGGLKKTFEGSRDEFIKDFVGAAKKLNNLYEEVTIQRDRLVDLASKWCTEGIYNNGFYHGDLHAGNIMIDDKFNRDDSGEIIKTGKDKNKGMTIIDFGNATSLTESEQKDVIRMMGAAATKNTDMFLDGFNNLLSPEGKQKLAGEKKRIHDVVHNIIGLGSKKEAGQRIAAILQELQLYGYELPAPIFKFSQCQMRLQGTIDEMNAKLAAITAKREQLLYGGIQIPGSSILLDPLAYALHKSYAPSGNSNLFSKKLSRGIDSQFGKSWWQNVDRGKWGNEDDGIQPGWLKVDFTEGKKDVETKYLFPSDEKFKKRILFSPISDEGLGNSTPADFITELLFRGYDTKHAKMSELEEMVKAASVVDKDIQSEYEDLRKHLAAMWEKNASIHLKEAEDNYVKAFAKYEKAESEFAAAREYYLDHGEAHRYGILDKKDFDARQESVEKLKGASNEALAAFYELTGDKNAEVNMYRDRIGAFAMKLERAIFAVSDKTVHELFMSDRRVVETEDDRNRDFFDAIQEVISSNMMASASKIGILNGIKLKLKQNID